MARVILLKVCALVLAVSACTSAAPREAGHERAAPGEGVRFDDQRLTVDGETVFPFGLLWRASGVSPDVIRDHHMNVTLTDRSDADLAAARAAGLYTVAGYHSPGGAARLASDPSFLAWFLADDLASDDHVEFVRERVAGVRRIDPHRPIFANVIGHSPEANAPFAELLDVVSPYRYPFPLETVSWYRDYLGSLHRATGHRSFWTVVQSSGIYSRHRGRLGLSDPDMRRFLTPSQLRLLVWTTVQVGARGVFFWPDYGLFDGTPEARERALEVSRLGMELEVVKDVLVMGDPISDVRVESDLPVEIAAVQKGTTMLVVITSTPPDAGLVYGDETPRNVTVTLSVDELSDGMVAHQITMDGMAEMTMTARRGAVELHLNEIDVTALVVLSPHDPAQLRARVAERAREYTATLAESYALEHANAARILLEISSLGYGRDVVPIPSGSVPTDAASLREGRRAIRAALATVQRRAAERRLAATPGADNLWMSPHTLPEFYASLMDATDE